MSPRTQTTLNELLEFVKERRGFDFTGYKRSSIERRVAKRMGEVGVESYEAYIDYLELHADEFANLFNTILINVTSFFRDEPAWEYLAEEVLPGLVAARPPDAPLRVWVPGCASGEEAYTVAMVLARVLGDEVFRERVKIYATDADEEALDEGRHAAYLPRQVEPVPQEALERFFERIDQRYVFRKDLRRCVIFGRNDLVQDAPISHLDLLVCRNTLMYFMAETQSQILRRFHFALDDDGVLMLGKSEMLITRSELFTPVDLKRRVFRKVPRATMRKAIRALASDPQDGASLTVAESLRDAAFDLGDSPKVVLDAERVLVMANEQARRIFGLTPMDIGRPINDLELFYRPVELRGHLELLMTEPRALEIKSVPWLVGDESRVLDIRLVPLLSEDVHAGTMLTYTDVTEAHRLRDELEASKRELEHAYEELQATVEELETTNEELQSTNEELETMNEELQSSNEELETMNDELRHRSAEINDMNSFLETILTTMGLAVAVLDKDLRVQIWNGQARELWGLSPDEVEDQNMLALDIGLPVELLTPALRATLNGADGEELVVQATNRRGREFDCKITVLPLQGRSDNGASGAIVMMETVADGAARR